VLVRIVVPYPAALPLRQPYMTGLTFDIRQICPSIGQSGRSAEKNLHQTPFARSC
jgi:hypothetical protein